jgi:pyridoxine 5-phosphate synthase
MSFSRPRLGVNIDHVATLRQARGEEYPSVTQAAATVIDAGADQITIHLREDRRHIQDRDVFEVFEVTQAKGVPLNLELGCHPEIVDIALQVKPQWVCIVPEKREERTTEGGLNLGDRDHFQRVFETLQRIKENSRQTQISLFVEANDSTHQAIAEMMQMIRVVDAVEIHTGEYAIDLIAEKDLSHHFDRFAKYKDIYHKMGLGYHAGHGLTDESTAPLVSKNLFEEYNIGHWIVSESIFKGLKTTVADLKKVVQGQSL